MTISFGAAAIASALTLTALVVACHIHRPFRAKEVTGWSTVILAVQVLGAGLVITSFRL